ncbi:MAG: hypothetical protein IKP56_03420 [Bacilli bacterium]|nr:hypothetical protein [Bacilli bacterium]
MNGEWVFSADATERYWDQKWGTYNCYSYAMQRYDIVPEYFQSIVTPYEARWYQPGVISSVYDPTYNTLTAYEQAEAVVSDFEVMGYTNVSASLFTGTLPVLGTDEELIAVRTTEPPGFYDYHFMRYNKADGCWYHKPGGGDVLKYEYALSEQLVWSGELPSFNPESNTYPQYSSDIWLIKYTRPPVLSVSADDDLYESLYIDNIGDKVVVLDVEDPGHLELSFYNVNGFSAILYTEDWDALGVATYNPIEVDVAAGRHYLVMKNWRYCNDVYVSALLSPIVGGTRSCDDGRSFAIAENDRIILGRIIDGSLVEIGIEPIRFLEDGQEATGL